MKTSRDKYQTRQVLLGNEMNREAAKLLIDKAPLDPFRPLEVLIREQVKKRGLDANALLHCILTEISDSLEWKGQKLSMEVWKRLCVASWLREQNQSPMLIPALDGNGIDIIYEKTSKLSVTQCSSLIEWCFAFGAENGVRFKSGRMESGSV